MNGIGYSSATQASDESRYERLGLDQHTGQVSKDVMNTENKIEHLPRKMIAFLLNTEMSLSDCRLSWVVQGCDGYG